MPADEDEVRDAVRTAHEADEAIRILDSLIMPANNWCGLDGVHDVYAVVCSLNGCARGLRQSLGHLSTFVESRQRKNRLQCGDGSDPDRRVSVAKNMLGEAANAADEMAALLEGSLSTLSWLSDAL